MLNKLLSFSGLRKTKKRVGRGPGSGKGKTSGKGHKGQKSRSGFSKKIGFEGGQTPLQRRLPKKGFKNFTSKKWNLFNIKDIEKIKKFNFSEVITSDDLFDAGIIKNKKFPTKLLSTGEIGRSINISVAQASVKAVKKIENAGGKVLINNSCNNA